MSSRPESAVRPDNPDQLSSNRDAWSTLAGAGNSHRALVASANRPVNLSNVPG